MASPGTSVRQSGDERRAAIIEAAVAEFSLHGYSGVSTEAIARRVGISQPYIFRLFGTKKELFLAACDRVYSSILALFVQAAEGAAASEISPLAAMEASYRSLLSQQDELRMLLQSFAAGGDTEIQARVRGRYQELVVEVARHANASPQEIFEFFAAGMMLTVSAALDMPELHGGGPGDV